MQPWELAERLDAAPDAEAAWTVGTTALSDLGAAGAIWVDAAGVGPPRLRSTLDPAWQADNARALAAGTDPFPRHCLSRLAPLRTGTAHLHRYPYLPAASRRVVLEAGDRTGFAAGIALPMLVASDGRGQGWNLLTEGGADALDALLRERGAMLALAAHLVHARLVAAKESSPEARAPDRTLTPRERDCLALVAEGLRAAELAHRLGVSEATVEFHLTNARRKLGARTRDHAVALALRAGVL